MTDSSSTNYVRTPRHLRQVLLSEEDAGRRMEIIDGALRPPEPQLLDTCVVQNLDWVDRTTDSAGGSVCWDEPAEAALRARFGEELADDLLDLGTLYRQFEWRSGYPWLVCAAAIEEAGLLQGDKGDRLRSMLGFVMGHQECIGHDTFPGLSAGLLLAKEPARVSPLVLRAMGVEAFGDLYSATGPLRFLPDRGDRLVVAYALVSNIPTVLTTDRRTFWNQRERLEPFGVSVIRPSELLDLYIPYWAALDDEFARRRSDAKR